MEQQPRQPIRLNYAPPARRLGRRLWWGMLLLAVGLGGFTFLLFLPVDEVLPWKMAHLRIGTNGTPVNPVDFRNRSDSRFELVPDWRLNYVLVSLPYLALFLLTQWLLLMPRGRLRLPLDVEGRPMKRAAVAAGFVAMLLSAGVVAVILEWPMEPDGSIWIYAFFDEEQKAQHFGLFWLFMLGLWVLWAVIFHLYGRSLDRHTWLTRIFRGLLAGTVLELLVAGPAHAWVARNDDCYCARGTYTGLVFGLTAAFWLFGPGVFLLLLREKRRLERLDPV
jgi:hypothetical protein